MAAVSPAQPEPRITVSRISVISFPISILDASARFATQAAIAPAPASGGFGKRRAFFIIMSPMANLTLIYGLRLLPEGEVTEIQDATLKLANGHQAHVTMHMIEGSREEIETQLKRSLDAFFDFYPEI